MALDRSIRISQNRPTLHQTPWECFHVKEVCAWSPAQRSRKDIMGLQRRRDIRKRRTYQHQLWAGPPETNLQICLLRAKWWVPRVSFHFPSSSPHSWIIHLWALERDSRHFPKTVRKPAHQWRILDFINTPLLFFLFFVQTPKWVFVYKGPVCSVFTTFSSVEKAKHLISWSYTNGVLGFGF